MRRWLHIGSAVLLLASLVSAPTALAADEESTDTLEKRKSVHMWFPPSDFYPRYIADPTRPQNALTIQWLADTEIPETGAGRFGLRLGGLLGIYRWHRQGEPDRGWQISFEGGFAGQFDMEFSLDNTGWDGFFGLYLDRMLSRNLGLRVGTQHDSSHIGDEYAERTGRERIDYTREELILGVSWRMAPRWRSYGEVGYGGGFDGAEPWGVEVGAEFIGPQKHLKGTASRYAAIDIRSYQETDWRPRINAQLGYLFPVGTRGNSHRLAIELGTGRSVMGQFFEYDETWLGVGWFYDF